MIGGVNKACFPFKVTTHRLSKRVPERALLPQAPPLFFLFFCFFVSSCFAFVSFLIFFLSFYFSFLPFLFFFLGWGFFFFFCCYPSI